MKNSTIVRLAYEKGYRITPAGLAIGVRGKRIKTRTSGNGYPRFNIATGHGKSSVCQVHRLQAFQKYGEFIFLRGVVCRHLDNNRLNNHHTNIGIGSQFQNIMDSRADRKAKNPNEPWYNHDEVFRHFDTYGWKSTLAHFQMKRDALYYIIHKSATAAIRRKAKIAAAEYRRPQEAAA